MYSIIQTSGRVILKAHFISNIFQSTSYRSYSSAGRSWFRQLTCLSQTQDHFKAFWFSDRTKHAELINCCPSSTDAKNNHNSITDSKGKNPASNSTKDEKVEVSDACPEEDGKKLGIFKRFHQTYKQHGKILICVHLVTSAIWTSVFYYAAVSGVDVVPVLQWLGASDKIMAAFTTPGVSHAAVTYLMYKLATPVRYTVTITGTHLTVRYLRSCGYLPQIPTNNTIRSLVQEKVTEVRDDLKERRSKGGNQK